MSSTAERPWRRLKGHTNEGEVKRCERCYLPRWLRWDMIGAAGLMLLVGLVFGGYSLSVFLKEQDYRSLVRQVWGNDEMISPEEGKQLNERADYLRLTAEQSLRLEQEVAGESAEPQRALTEEAPAPLQEEEIQVEVAAEVSVQELQSIHEDLEHGRFEQARHAITDLVIQDPQNEEVNELKAALNDKIGGYMEMRMLGDTAGDHEMDSPTAILAVRGERVRFFVQPHETTFFYIYSVDSDGKVDMLFPKTHTDGSNPLNAGQEYWIPSYEPEHGYVLEREGRSVEQLYLVSSRWPARELEQWEAELSGSERRQAYRELLDTLHARKLARVGGCDMRTVEFADKQR